MDFREGLKFKDALNFLKLFLYLCKNQKQIDAVHYYSTLLVLFGPILTYLVGIPAVVTLTGFGRAVTNPQFQYRLLRPIYFVFLWISIRLSDRMLFQNHADQKMIARRFPRLEHKLTYVGSAVVSSVVNQKNFDGDTSRVLLVARLLPDKGIDDFIEIATRLRQEEFEFVLVGPSSVGYDELLDRVKVAHQRGIIRYLGELDTVATEKQFHQAHIFYFPSYYGEGMPRVMLEAGFAKACPIAYDISANLDLVQEDRGFLVPTGDIDQVERNLKELNRDKKKIECHAAAYQKHILENFRIESYAHRLDEVFAELKN
jgi:glycosyltransferase involved in cell wall biosynthesis